MFCAIYERDSELGLVYCLEMLLSLYENLIGMCRSQFILSCKSDFAWNKMVHVAVSILCSLTVCSFRLGIENV